ncbi:MAG: hypothetical protein R8G66_17685 [Cytophagales bacterium]|nr:hypothetical protein [Cytophagales bacterium]
MKELFIEKFKSRNKEELLSILHNPSDYQPGAVEAARELLLQLHDVGPESLITATPEAEPTKNHRSNHRKIAYFRTFSSREIWSSLSTAALFILMLGLSRTMFEGIIAEWLLAIIGFLLLLSSNIINHIFYQKEHGRRNPFWSGFIQFTITATWVYLFLIIRNFLSPTGNLELKYLPASYLIMLLLAFFIEAFTQFIRYLSTVLKWRTW